MGVTSVLLLLAIVAVSLVSALIPGDQVSNLPGYGKPPTRHFSGLIPADSRNTTYLHYWLVESSNKPTTDPLVLWLNGGPGCSSLEGLLYELGPLHFSGDTDSQGIPILIKNPSSWSNTANVMFLESPAGVGFSYYVNQSTTSNDEITSQNNYGFLLNFFAAYPEYASRDFYITGESYAGIYIPTLVKRIQEGNAAGNPKINLVGFAIGNGCWGNQVGTCQFGLEADFISLDFFHGHVFVSQPHWLDMISKCGNVTNPNPTQDCYNAADTALNDADAANYDIYNIYVDCPNLLEERMKNPLVKDYYSRVKRLAEKSERHQFHTQSKKNINTPDKCISPQLASTWLELPAVQQALHVTISNLTSWSVCFGINYDRTERNLLPIYPSLLQDYRALIYSGETDACVPYVGSEAWTRNLGYPVKTPWYA